MITGDVIPASGNILRRGYLGLWLFVFVSWPFPSHIFSFAGLPFVDVRAVVIQPRPGVTACTIPPGYHGRRCRLLAIDELTGTRDFAIFGMSPSFRSISCVAWSSLWHRNGDLRTRFLKSGHADDDFKLPFAGTGERDACLVPTRLSGPCNRRLKWTQTFRWE